MGMDMNLIRARSKESMYDYDIGTAEYYYDAEDEYEAPVVDVYYSRKFWDLYNAMSFTKDYECGSYLRLTKENVKEMLDYSVIHPDYFNDFNTVKDLCRVYYKFDEWEAHGFHVYFECDW